MRELKHGGMGVFVAAKNQVAAKNGSVFLLKWFNDTLFRLHEEGGHIIENTQVQLAALVETNGESHHHVETFVIDNLMKGKANTAHCLRFIDDWFHVFGIGRRTVGFSIRVEVKTKSKTMEVVVGLENRTAISNDKFLSVNMLGDYVGYTDIPAFDDVYLVIPRQVAVLVTEVVN
ncbi:hypothetical protein OROGR_014766 [Orobanche gracilis]